MGTVEPMPLTRDQIVDAAIRILDDEGPDALSMRRLGAELRAGTTSVYWHVRGKDELLDLVSDRVIGEVFAGIGATGTWRAWMAAFARSMRRVLLAHPGVAPVVGRRATAGPNALLALEGLFGRLAADGFDRTTSMLASTTLVGWTTTLVLAEVREARDGAGPLVADGAIPTADARFEYGLEVLLDGIAAREARIRGGTGDG
jgi:AcrR family transcriptional regulator